MYSCFSLKLKSLNIKPLPKSNGDIAFQETVVNVRKTQENVIKGKKIILRDAEMS